MCAFFSHPHRKLLPGVDGDKNRDLQLNNMQRVKEFRSLNLKMSKTSRNQVLLDTIVLVHREFSEIVGLHGSAYDRFPDLKEVDTFLLSLPK